jgi:thiol-disulfide isomerase/thioredoxin
MALRGGQRWGSVLALAVMLACVPGVSWADEPAVKLSRAVSRDTLFGRKPIAFADAFSQRKKAALVLNFFAADCGPCRAELPEIAELAAQPGVELWIVAISRPQNERDPSCGGQAELQTIFEREAPGLKDRVLFDDCGNLLKKLSPGSAQALPVTFLFGEKLEAVQVQRGRAPEGSTLLKVFGGALGRMRK